MVRRNPRPRRSDCPISLSLELFGDQWSLLVVRDLLFKGLRTFQEFAAAGEGIATNVLTERLVRLETSGILTRERDPEDGRKLIYRLTEKGFDLAPVLIEMVLWAARHEETGAPPAVVDEMRNRKPRFLRELRKSWQAKSLTGVEVTAPAERGA